MHRAKGLEFQVVFIMDCNEEICPHSKSQTAEEIEEEISEEQRKSEQELRIRAILEEFLA